MDDILGTLIGLALLAAGIGLLIWGYQLYNGFGSQVEELIGGAPSTKTMIVLISGIVCSILGVVKLR